MEYYFLLFIFGLAIGSFINVVSLRYRPDQKILDRKIIGGRSHCPDCLKTLAWYELVPILSFLIQKGKCRSCGHRLSFQYPLVELLSGLIFVFVPLILFPSVIAGHWSLNQWLTIIAWFFIFTILLLISIIDLRHLIIPNQANLSLGIMGAVLTALNYYGHRFDFINGSFFGHYAIIFGLRENIWLNHLAAALLGMAVFGAIIFFSRGRAMGLGDFKLIAALGLIFGWPDILMVMSLAFIIGALVGICLLIRGNKKMKDAVPFGPFLITAAAFTFFFGYQIIDGYFKLFGL